MECSMCGDLPEEGDLLSNFRVEEDEYLLCGECRPRVSKVVREAIELWPYECLVPQKQTIFDPFMFKGRGGQSV